MNLRRGPGIGDIDGIRLGRFVRFVVLDLELLEHVGPAAVEHRSVQKVGAADPSIQSFEIAPDADENYLLAPVRVHLTSDLGKDEAVVLACVVQYLLGLFPEYGHLPGMDAALENPDDQVPPQPER